jgi:hypothetical protein
MTAVILAAGKSGRDYPPNGKPKCLHHIAGRAAFDVVVQALLDAGLTRIRVVLGYRGDDIRQHAARRKWDLEFVWSTVWETDSVRSIEVGIEGVDDDVLLLCADILIDADLIRGFLRVGSQLAWIRSEIPWSGGADQGYDDLYRNDIDNSVVIIPRGQHHIFEGSRERADRFIARYRWDPGTPIGPGSGLYWGAALTETFNEHRPIAEVVIRNPIYDIDFYAETDEFKIASVLRARKPAGEAAT